MKIIHSDFLALHDYSSVFDTLLDENNGHYYL